jgi:hypothetical protein
LGHTGWEVPGGAPDAWPFTEEVQRVRDSPKVRVRTWTRVDVHACVFTAPHTWPLQKLILPELVNETMGSHLLSYEAGLLEILSLMAAQLHKVMGYNELLPHVCHCVASNPCRSVLPLTEPVVVCLCNGCANKCEVISWWLEKPRVFLYNCWPFVCLLLKNVHVHCQF